MYKKSIMIKIGILFGGKSAEHEISLQSAKSIYDFLDSSKYEPVLIGIDKDGKWYLTDSISFQGEKKPVYLLPENIKLDLVFPVLHGPFGEDGTVQGLLKLADIPFAGSGVLSSAVCMDKDITKRLLRDAGIPIGKFLTLNLHEPIPSFKKIEENLGNPVFVKPANLGSSVGISKVYSEAEFNAALTEAFKHDKKIILEEFIPGREIECAVLGNENPKASLAGEIIPSHDFYSYSAKYTDEKGAELIIPAKLENDILKQIQELSVKVFKVLGCKGLARVDFFLKKDGEIIVNEINTMPGFTKISMFPKLWEASGISYSELVTALIELAVKEHS